MGIIAVMSVDLNPIKVAYKNFIESLNVEDRAFRQAYFSAINDVHTRCFFDPKSFMHNDVYFHEAEMSLQGAGKLKYNIFARCRLSRLAQRYVDTFEELNAALSSRRSSETVLEKIGKLERAHYDFSEKFSAEYESFKKYRLFASRLGIFLAVS